MDQRNEPGSSRDAFRSEFDALAATVEQLQRRAASNDEEIYELRVQGAKGKRPWFRDPSVVIASLALVLSLTATVLTQLESSRARNRETRQQLTSYIRQLGDLEQNSGASSNDYLLLADEAAVLMEQVPATAIEYILVAEAFSIASEYGRAEEMFGQAERRARSLVELVTIRRGRGFVRLDSGDLEGGREEFDSALRTVESDQYRATPASVRSQLRFDTELFWLDAELRQHQCSAAREHLSRVQAYRAQAAETLRVPANLDPYRKRLAECSETASP